MNNLVDYGSDSDEDLAQEMIQNENVPSAHHLIKPIIVLPPQKVYSFGLKISHSQSSLLAYEDREIVDSFDEDFEKHVEPSTSDVSDNLVEPRPPKRPCDDDDDKSDRSPDESDIDNAVKEGMTALKYMADDTVDAEPGTPRSNTDSGCDDAVPKSTTTKVELPPSPPGDCAPEIHNRFIKFFELKAQGMKMNEKIKSHKNFKNPALYEFLVAKYNIDEKGTNFHSKIFNPHRFKKEDFYTSLTNEQQKLHEQMTKSVEAKKLAQAQAPTVASALLTTQANDASKSKKYVLVRMASIVSGTTKVWLRDKMAPKSAEILYDPSIGQNVLFKEIDTIKGKNRLTKFVKWKYKIDT